MALKEFFKDPQYDSLKTVGLLLLVVGAGVFAYNHMNTGQSAKVLNTGANTQPGIVSGGFHWACWGVNADHCYDANGNVSNAYNCSGMLEPNCSNFKRGTAVQGGVSSSMDLQLLDQGCYPECWNQGDRACEPCGTKGTGPRQSN